MKKEAVKPVVTATNLHAACGKEVALPAFTVRHMGRGFSEFALCQLWWTSEHGSAAFTEVYFSTKSGNVYKIFRPVKDQRNSPAGWFMINVRGTKGQREPLHGYQFSQGELLSARLEVGRSFRYGAGVTTTVVGILCVDTNRCCSAEQETDFTSDIWNEFERMIAG